MSLIDSNNFIVLFFCDVLEGSCDAGKLAGLTGKEQPALRRGKKIKFAISEVLVLFCRDKTKEVVHNVVCVKGKNGTYWKPRKIPDCQQTSNSIDESF